MIERCEATFELRRVHGIHPATDQCNLNARLMVSLRSRRATRKAIPPALSVSLAIIGGMNVGDDGHDCLTPHRGIRRVRSVNPFRCSRVAGRAMWLRAHS